MNAEYAQATTIPSYANTGAPAPSRPLDRISVAADRIERLASLVADFNERFSGPRPPVALSGSTEPVYMPGHNSHLSRLFDQLERLEIQVSSLNEIG